MATLSTPTAIVTGLALLGVFTGTGLYMGLRSRNVGPYAAGAAVDSVTSVATLASSSPASSIATATGSEQVSAAGSRRSNVADEVKRAFATKHDQILRDCWYPAVAKTAEPQQVTITFLLGYGADGHVITRGLREDRVNFRPDVTACVNREMESPVVSPPGAPTRIDVPIVLP